MVRLAAIVPAVLLAMAALAQQPAPPAPAPAARPTPPASPYTETIKGTKITFDMVPIAGGTFRMGSPASEKGRKRDEGPQREVTVRPFFMGKHEVTWDAYHIFLDLGVQQTLAGNADEGPDALTYPTPPYADETFGLGRDKNPNIAVTWHAAVEFARWVSSRTGKTYRLPTEAEWEYACRGGGATAYGFGPSAAKLRDHAWYSANAGKRPHPVGGKRPNGFGLFDMHGNVSEWVLDRYQPDFYASAAGSGPVVNLPGDARYPHVVRGGSWKESPPALRCAARRFSEPIWSKQDPQTPQSIWWHTEATEVGFRLVHVPDDDPVLRRFRSKMTEDSANR